MWLLRDAHLDATIDGKYVSEREYFTNKVLKHEMGFSSDIMLRQQIRGVFLQLFEKYDAFALPMPHSDEDLLKQLGIISRDELQPAFNSKLTKFCDKVVKETKPKALYTRNSNGNDQFVLCTGFRKFFFFSFFEINFPYIFFVFF